MRSLVVPIHSIVLALLAILILLPLPANANVPTEVTPGAKALLWSFSGEDESVILGAVRDVLVQEDGAAYVLDSQSMAVHAFDNSGNFIATVGRGGEGPGEFRDPRALVHWGSREVGVVQGRPPSVALLGVDNEEPRTLHLEWDPAEDRPYPMEARSNQRFVHLRLHRDKRLDDSFATRVEIRRLESSGALGAVMDSVTGYQPLQATVIEEVMPLDRFSIWGIDHRGSLLFAPIHDQYIVLRASSGSTAQAWILREDVRPLARTTDRLARIDQHYAAMARMYPGAPSYRIEPNERTVVDLFPRSNGTLWILQSRGYRDAEADALGTFDVYDENGQLTRRVTLAAPFDPECDQLFLRDDHVFIVVGGRSALRAQTRSRPGGDDTQAQDECAPDQARPPMTLECYRLD